VGTQYVHALCIEPKVGNGEACRELLYHESSEGQYVVPALPQGGNLDFDDAQTIEKVLAEGAVDHALIEIPVSRGKDPDVDRTGLALADPQNLPFLQHAENLELHRRADIPDLVQEHGSSRGLLKQPDPVLHGSREGAPGVAEEFSFQQTLGKSAAVDR